MFGVLSLFGGGKVIVPEVAVFKGVGRGFLAGRVAASWYLYGNPVCESQSQPYEGWAKFGGRAWMSTGKGMTTRSKYGNFAVNWLSLQSNVKWIIFEKFFENYQTSTIFRIKTFRKIMLRIEDFDRLAIKSYRQWSLLS